MADRNIQYSQNQGFGMMQGMPQFVQPGSGMMQAPNRMMMATAPIMGPTGQPNMLPQGQMGMYPMAQMSMGNMRMMGPAGAPPSYNQARMDSMQMRNPNKQNSQNRPVGKSEEQLQKERYYQQQQAKLKQFGRSSGGGSSSLDANKLIDSMFGNSQPPKPRSNKKQNAQHQEMGTDDGFGDFLSGPHSTGEMQGSNPQMVQATPNALGEMQGSNPQMVQATPSIVTVSVSKVVPTKPVPERKDLTKMMFESCDLNAPQKAKLFQKPSLKDITVPNNQAHLVASNVSLNARRWDHTEALSDLFIQEAVKDVKRLPPKPQAPPVKKATSPTSKHPPKPPPWLLDDSLIPQLYIQVLEASLVEGKIATDRLYPILLLSGLPKEKLGFIWSLCNQETPGQLVVKELYQILAIIALTQNNFQVETTDILSRCPNAPVPFLAQPGGGQTPMTENQQQVPVPQPQTHIQAENQQAPISQSQINTPQTGPQTVSNPQVGVQGFPQGSGPITSQFQGTQPMPQSSHMMGMSTVTSSPATLSVTQLPPAVLPQGMVGNVVNSGPTDDEFADFQTAPTPSSTPHFPAAPPTGKTPHLQAAPPSGNIPPPPPGTVKRSVTDVKIPKRSLKDDADYLYSVPVPDDKAIAEAMSPDDFKSSTVSNFFASDDSSEATSPDDDYFDGYKSAESKPSDSTSQFSTDQSENEDFKNFESYLDEFQKKKEQRDKESPLHRPIPKFSQAPKGDKSPSPVKIAAQVVTNIKAESKAKVSSDEISDFADFQSAPVGGESVTDSNPLKATASASDLIGDEDKYAALRSLDFNDLAPGNEPSLLGEPELESKPPEDTDEDNWADFEAATVPSNNESNDTSQVVTDLNVSGSGAETNDKDMILKMFKENKGDGSDWSNLGGMISAPTENDNTEWAAFSERKTTVDPHNVGQSTSLFNTDSNDLHTSAMPDTMKSEPVDSGGDDWADFQSTRSDNTENFEAFQSAITDTSNDLVKVKNDKLGSAEILSLFKVKDTPPQGIKSMDDDDVFVKSKTSVSVSQSVNRMHGISPSHVEEPVTAVKPKVIEKKKIASDDDDFMKPPPLDSVNDDDFEPIDEFGTYAGGYDLDDIMHPKVPEKKNVYGVYGLNQNFVVSGHKKESKPTTGDGTGQNPMNNITIEVTKELDMDDSDSVSSKDNDTFRGKFGLGKELCEDSQSVSSLDFIVNKRVHTLKDGDTQSVSSDFGNFENGVSIGGTTGLPFESKSVDSLELRQDEGQEGNTSGSQENSDKESKEESPDRILTENNVDNKMFDTVPTTQGLPIIGDRYSAILSDVPGSDKHAYEWQRLLDNACRMIQDANNIFNSISSSSVCNEVIKSTQGSEYIQGVVEIYRVVCKVITSMKDTGISNDKLSKHSKDIDLAWNNLTAFLVGKSILPDSKTFAYRHGILHSEDTTAQYRSCGVCLLNVDMMQKGDNSEDNSNLTYGGRQYHTACANFWINCVDSTLPALKLPELL